MAGASVVFELRPAEVAALPTGRGGGAVEAVAAEVVRLLLRPDRAKETRAVLLELHESKEAALPVYGVHHPRAAAAVGRVEAGRVVTVLGCVEDHLAVVGAVQAAWRAVGGSAAAVREKPPTKHYSVSVLGCP